MTNNYLLLTETRIPTHRMDEMIRHFMQPCTIDPFFPRKLYSDSHGSILELSFFKDIGELRYIIDTEEKKYREDAICELLQEQTKKSVYAIAGTGHGTDFAGLESKHLELYVQEPDFKKPQRHGQAEAGESESLPPPVFVDDCIICTPLLGHDKGDMILSAFSCDIEQYRDFAKNTDSDVVHSHQQGSGQFFIQREIF